MKTSIAFGLAGIILFPTVLAIMVLATIFVALVIVCSFPLIVVSVILYAYISSFFDDEDDELIHYTKKDLQ